MTATRAVELTASGTAAFREVARHDGERRDGDGRDRDRKVGDRLAAIRRLIDAANGLAATIAATEELSQRRAELLNTRSTIIAPRLTRHGAQLISLTEAARRTGRHPEVLRRWCSDGRIPAVRVGRTWAITPETLMELREHSARSRPRFANGRSG